MSSSHRRLPNTRSKPLRQHLPTYVWMAALAMFVGAIATLGTQGNAATVAVAEPPASAASAPASTAPEPESTNAAAQSESEEPEDTESEPADNGPRRTRDGAAIIETRGGTDLGTVVTDGKGYTLYRFDKDSADPSQSACTGDCANTWLPVITSGWPKGEGVRDSLLGYYELPDGSCHVTLRGWPLYRFVGDDSPGQTNGDGLQGLWHAIGPDGLPV